MKDDQFVLTMYGIMEKIDEKANSIGQLKKAKEETTKENVESIPPINTENLDFLAKSLEHLKGKYDASFLYSDCPIEELPVRPGTYRILKKAGIANISDIFTMDFLAVSGLLRRSVVYDIHHGFHKLDLVKKKEAQLNSGEYQEIVEGKKRLLSSLSDASDEIDDLHLQVCEAEREYEKIAKVNNLFVDFGALEKEWSEINKQVSDFQGKVSQLQKECFALDKKDYVKEIKFGGLPISRVCNFWCYYLSKYSESMTKLMHNLAQKSKGSEYSLEEYQKDLAETEKNKARYLRSCDGVTRKQTTMSEENDQLPLEAQPFRDLTKRGITIENYLDHLDEMTDEEVSAMLLQKDPRGKKWEDCLRATSELTPRKLAEEIRDFSL